MKVENWIAKEDVLFSTWGINGKLRLNFADYHASKTPWLMIRSNGLDSNLNLYILWGSKTGCSWYFKVKIISFHFTSIPCFSIFLPQKCNIHIVCIVTVFSKCLFYSSWVVVMVTRLLQLISVNMLCKNTSVQGDNSQFLYSKTI